MAAAGGGEPVGPINHELEGECQFCFLNPCVTARGLQFVGAGQNASDKNSGIRRTKYRQYWNVVNNLGGWNDPRYITTKVERANGGEWAVKHKREVMPICVLKQLRTLYPNPKDKPYMDHKWD